MYSSMFSTETTQVVSITKRRHESRLKQSWRNNPTSDPRDALPECIALLLEHSGKGIVLRDPWPSLLDKACGFHLPPPLFFF